MTSRRVQRLWQRTHEYMQSGQDVAARATLESLLQRTPNDPQVRMSLAKLLLQREQMSLAAVQLLAAMPLLLANDGALLGEAAQLLLLVGETVAARDCLDQAQAVPDLAAPVLIQLAHSRHALGQPADALVLMERALAAGADSPYDHHFHSMLLQFVGRMDEAGKGLDECLRRWPVFGSAALTRARLRRQTPDTQHLDYLHKQLEQVPANSLDQACFEFALFKELDDLGRFDQAWPALERANAIMHARNRYDERVDRSSIEATIACCNGNFFAPADGEPTLNGPAPIFIVGMPRSGTTLLDRLLSNHSQVTSAGEISDFMQQWVAAISSSGQAPGDVVADIQRSSKIDFAQLGARYLKQTQWRAEGHAHYIDKMPNNLPMLGFIHRALPQARILYIHRDPMAVCFSNFKAMFGDSSAHSYDLRLLGRYWQMQDQLHRHWSAVLGGAMLDVSYAALVDNPEGAMRKVTDFCRLDFEPACVDPTRNTATVSTPSSAQVRGQIHARGLDDWKHYAAQLEPLQRAIKL